MALIPRIGASGKVETPTTSKKNTVVSTSKIPKLDASGAVVSSSNYSSPKIDTTINELASKIGITMPKNTDFGIPKIGAGLAGSSIFDDLYTKAKPAIDQFKGGIKAIQDISTMSDLEYDVFKKEAKKDIIRAGKATVNAFPQAGWNLIVKPIATVGSMLLEKGGQEKLFQVKNKDGSVSSMTIGAKQPEWLKSLKAKGSKWLEDAIDQGDEVLNQDLNKAVGINAETSIFDPAKLASTVTSGTISLASSIGLGTLLKSPWAVNMAFGFMEGSDDYNQAKKELTKSNPELTKDQVEEKAFYASMRSSAWIGLTEKFGYDTFVRGGLSAGAKGLFETFQEVIQQIGQNINEKYSYNDKRNIMDGVFETIVTMLPVGYFGAKVFNKLGIDDHADTTSKDIIERHLKTAEIEIADPDTKALIDQSPKEFIERTKINIVDGLKADGQPQASEAVKGIDISGIKDLTELESKVREVAESNGYVPNTYVVNPGETDDGTEKEVADIAEVVAKEQNIPVADAKVFVQAGIETGVQEGAKLKDVEAGLKSEADLEQKQSEVDKLIQETSNEVRGIDDILSEFDDNDGFADAPTVESKVDEVMTEAGIEQQETEEDLTNTITERGDDLSKPEGLAKDFIRTYVERGDTIKQLKDGQGGYASNGVSISIGGYENGKKISTDTIIVKTTTNGKENLNFVSLKKAFDEIIAERRVVNKQETKNEKGGIVESNGKQPNKNTRGDIRQNADTTDSGKNGDKPSADRRMDTERSKRLARGKGGERGSIARKRLGTRVADKILELEDKIHETYKGAGDSTVEGFSKADAALSEILTSFDLAEAGYRYAVDLKVGKESRGVKSTFPAWIPQASRNKSDLQYAIDTFHNVGALSYPQGTSVAKREFFDAMLDVMDTMLDVDTSEIRNNILKLYEQGEEAFGPDGSIKGEDVKSDGGISEEEIIAAFEKDATERQVAIGIDNPKTIESIVEAKTKINAETGEVELIGEATEEELGIIATFSPAGGMESKGAEGRGLLDEYYTPSEVVDMVGSILDETGILKDGMNILEPSVGIGNFIWGVPEEANIEALEINPMSARIAKLNHNNAKVFNKPFESLFISDRGVKKQIEAKYDLVLGNPPYGEHRGKYKGLGEEESIARYETYFIKRALDITKEGGYVVMVVPSGVLRSKNGVDKKAISQSGKLEKAYRLPNGTFDTTGIGTDILVFKKVKPSPEGTVLRSVEISDDMYFRSPMNSQNILGETKTRTGKFGEEVYVDGNIEDAMAKFYDARGMGYTEAKSEDVDVQEGIKEDIAESYKEDVYKKVQKKLPQNNNILGGKKTPNEIVDYVDTLDRSVETEYTREKDKGILDGTKQKIEKEKVFELREVSIEDIIEGDKDLQEYIDANEQRYPEGETPESVILNVENPIVVSSTGEVIDGYNRILTKSTDGKEKILAYVGTTAPVKQAKVNIESSKKDTARLELARYSKASEEDKKIWENTTATGELSEVDATKADVYFYKGSYFNKFNYLQGDIYEKLDALKEDKAKIDEAQYKKQFDALMSVRPERVTVDRMSVAPNTRFAQQMKLADKSLSDHFMEWVTKLPRAALGESSVYNIRQYVENIPVRGGDKLQNEQDRRTRRAEGDKLFKLFLTEELNKDWQGMVEDQYNRQFNSYYRPNYREVPLVGKLHTTFVGKELEIREHQLQGVGFLVNRGVGLLAHDVGLGKTMQMILSINEMLQRGWAKRPLIVVPSINVYNQWVKEIQELVPDVEITLLANLGGDFKGDLSTLEIPEKTISIVTEEGFKKLGFKTETYDSLTKDFYDVIEEPESTKRAKELQKSKAETEVGKGIKGTKEDRFFEDLGFDLLAIDEVHNANHIIGRAKMEEGKTSEFRGFQTKPSQYGIKAWLASQYILKNNSGRNVFLASATPFTNNPLEYYSILSLMARERMQRMGILNVNDFMAMFMEITTQHEFKANGTYLEKSEVRSFKNYQQFQKLLTEFIDFRDGVEVGIIRPDRVPKEYIVSETSDAIKFKDLAQDLFKDKDAGTLKAINELRAIAFSPFASRYYTGKVPSPKEFVEGSPKIKATIEIIKQSLKDNPKGGHLIYSTLGVEYFPLIQEYLISEKIVGKSEVQIISGATPKEKRSGIQDAFNEGKVKIVLGSDAIQEGVNLQKNTTDIYFLSLPWNFTSMRQVIGRGWRYGNKWKRIRINNVFTENSIDVFQSQKLQNKEKRYEESLKFKGDTLDVGDIDFEALKFDLITDPVARTELEYKFKQTEIEAKMKTKLAEQAYKNRKAAKLLEVAQKVKSDEKYVKDYPDAQWAINSLKSSKEKYEDIKAELKDKGFDVVSIENDIRKAEEDVVKMKAEVEALDKEKAKALKVAQLERDAMVITSKETDYKKFINERAEDNLTFYQDGPKFSRIGRPITEWSKSMAKLLTQEELDATIKYTQFGDRTDETMGLVKTAYQKYVDFQERDPKFSRDLSTSIIEKLGNRKTVSKQYIEDLTKMAEVKAIEREVILSALAEFGDVVQVNDFANAVNIQLLPLKRTPEVAPRYEYINLPKEIRGNVLEYEENIYQSPIKTIAGETHFGNQEVDDPKYAGKYYFGHTRVEDMTNISGGMVPNGTRRVIEVQSDLYQKGGMEAENLSQFDVTAEVAKKEFEAGKEVYELIGNPMTGDQELGKKINSISEIEELGDYAIRDIVDKKTNKLYQYTDPTAHFRMIREEIRRAGQDGKTRLLFPTGATALKVEGLGTQRMWNMVVPKGEVAPRLIPETLKVGLVVEQIGGGDWVITEVIGDGKFKAMPKEHIDSYRVGLEHLSNEELLSYAEQHASENFWRSSEQFDVSRKVDVNNPIYKFYDKEVQKFLKKIRPDLKTITDDQGVTWFETAITKEDAENPVLAFKRDASFTASAIGKDEIIKIIDDYKKRFKLENLDVDFANAIFTGEIDEKGNRIGAFAVSMDGQVVFLDKVTRTTPHHEMVHEVLNVMDKIDAFDGIKRMDLLQAVNGGKSFNKADVERLEEQLAVGYERYIDGKRDSNPGIVERFFEILSRLMRGIAEYFGADIDAIREFYDALYSGENKGEPVYFTSKRGLADVTRMLGEDTIIDFGLVERKAVFQADLQQLFKRIEEVNEQNLDHLDLRRADINAYEYYNAQARDIYLKDPNEFAGAKAFEDRSDKQTAEKDALDKYITTMLTPFFTLRGSSKEKVSKILMQGDKEATEYTNETLRTKNLNEEEIKAYRQVRNAFRVAQAYLVKEMKEKGASQEEMDQFTKIRLAYMPHKWTYNNVVKKQVMNDKGSWITVEMEDFKSVADQEKAWKERNAENKDAGTQYVIDTLKNIDTDFFSQYLASIKGVEQIINQANIDADTKEKVLAKVRDLFKEKGFGRHFIKRSGVAGYSETEVPKIVADYFSGFSGFITKMRAAKDYYQILQTVDARKQSDFHRWLFESISYRLNSASSNIIASYARSVAYIAHLAFDISFLITNLTQNFVIGTGEMSKYMTGAQKAYKPEALILKAMFDWNTGLAKSDEKEVVNKLLERGQLGGEMVAELMGFKNNPIYQAISSKFSKALYKSTALVERDMNRVPTFLAMRRLFLEQGMEEKEANDKALDVQKDIHFRYGKGNTRKVARGNVGGTLLIFQNYMISFLHNLYRDVSKREFMSFGRKMIYTAVLGGASALPFANTIIAIYKYLFAGDDDDEVKKELEDWEILVQKGTPALLGVDMSGSVGINIMGLNKIVDDPSNVLSYLGAFGGIIKRVYQGIQFIGQEQYIDAVGKLLPDVLANPAKAYAGYNWGVRSFAGTPLEDANGDVFKYNTFQAIVKGLGFTPTEESILWDAKAREWEIKDRKTALRTDIRRTIQAQIQRGEFEEARQTQLEALQAGTIDESTDYVKEFGKEVFVGNALEKWNGMSKNADTLKSVERELIKDIYGADASDLQKNNIRKEFAVYRNFGLKDKYINDILSAQSNEEKVNILLTMRDKLGANDFSEYYNKGRRTITLQSGREGHILISDELNALYIKRRNAQRN